jgi:hypothetical protein
MLRLHDYGINPFLQFPVKELMKAHRGIGSGRYYARLGQAEFLAGRTPEDPRNVWFLEAFDAEWFDRNPVPPTTGDWVGYYAEASLFLLELRLGRAQIRSHEALRPIQRAQGKGYEAAAWFAITISSSASVAGGGDSLNATVYWNLYEAGTPVTIANIQPADGNTTAQLRNATSTRRIPSAKEREVVEALAGIGRIEWAVVYDVGQGNAIGLCRPDGAVAAYFDFGGGVLQNRATFPAALQRFCFKSQPPIILSHWDWDHWSSASRAPISFQSTWIAPRQSVGPIQKAQMANISREGRLLLLSNNFAPFWQGQLYFERCTGGGRNHSGLALTLAERDGGNGQRMLMPGDARYSALPSFSPQNDYCCVVAPHHGGDMRNRSIPASPQQSHSRLAYSFGTGNTFEHPSDVTRHDHAARGWRDRRVAFGTGVYEARETALRGQPPLGHVLLGWHRHNATPPLNCGGISCQLQAQQL